MIEYPLLPWLPPIFVGMIFGRLFHENLQRDQEGQAYFTAGLWGVICLVLFFIIRFAHSFGNINPPPGGYLSEPLPGIALFNVIKYPPSLAFLLINVGGALAMLPIIRYLRLADRWIGKPLLIYGRSALFFYIVHLPLAFGLTILFTWAGFYKKTVGMILIYVGKKKRLLNDSVVHHHVSFVSAMFLVRKIQARQTFNFYLAFVLINAGK